MKPLRGRRSRKKAASPKLSKAPTLADVCAADVVASVVSESSLDWRESDPCAQSERTEISWAADKGCALWTISRLGGLPMTVREPAPRSKDGIDVTRPRYCAFRRARRRRNRSGFRRPRRFARRRRRRPDEVDARRSQGAARRRHA